MATLSLSNYNTYASYRKCGEILKSPVIGDKQFALLCLQCHEICLQFKTFMIHIEREHQVDAFDDIIAKEENTTHSLNEPFDSMGEYGKTVCDGEEEDNKDFVIDPLEEPEVLLLEKTKQKDNKSKAPNKTQTRQSSSDLKKKSAVLSKKTHEKLVVKQEPQDDVKVKDAATDVTANEIEFVNSNIQSDEDDLDIGDLEDTKDAVPKRIKRDVNKDLYTANYEDEEEDDDDDDILRDEDYDDEEDDDDDDKEFLDEIKDGEDDDARPSPAKKSKVKLDDGLDIDEFMNNRVNVLLFIESYQKQDELWDATRPPKLVNRCRKKRDECLKQICQELQEINVPMTIRDAEKCIKYMRVRYIRDVRIRLKYIKNKDKDYKPLWFHDHLEFLKPTLSFIQELQEEQLLAKPKLNDDQITSLIEIYKKHSCLWNEQDIFYYSDQRRHSTLLAVVEDIQRELQLTYSLTEVEEKIEFIHKIVKKEKESIIEHTAANKPLEDYKSSSKFAQHISFLLPHLGPFKCQFCPKILMHIATFRIHTAKHDGSKPFKCSICMYEFTQKPGYVIHLRRHTQDFPFVCKYCGKGFPCKKELMLHFQNHPEYEKGFICDVCGEGFTQQKLLNWHLKAHNNIRDSICNICGKGFTNSKLLFQHRTVHSQEKSVCKLCGKTYAHYRGLSRHMAKDHGTTVAAVAAVMGEKPKKRVLTINEIS